jgi:hypothetical protein
MMAEGLVIDPSTTRYGPVGFAAAMVNILVLEVVTWLFIPWLILAFFALPVILVDLAVSAMLARCAGKRGQAGRGMLIGCISAPVSLVIFIPAIIIAHEIGPI